MRQLRRLLYKVVILRRGNHNLLHQPLHLLPLLRQGHGRLERVRLLVELLYRGDRVHHDVLREFAQVWRLKVHDLVLELNELILAIGLLK